MNGDHIAELVTFCQECSGKLSSLHALSKRDHAILNSWSGRYLELNLLLWSLFLVGPALCELIILLRHCHGSGLWRGFPRKKLVWIFTKSKSLRDSRHNVISQVESGANTIPPPSSINLISHGLVLPDALPHDLISHGLVHPDVLPHDKIGKWKLTHDRQWVSKAALQYDCNGHFGKWSHEVGTTPFNAFRLYKLATL